MSWVSVVIPLFNKEHCIGDTIQSVLAQTFVDFELIIVDDGSTDNSLTVAKSFDDKRIVVYHKENDGVSATRNFGVNRASSDLIVFLDADDYLYPSCLETFMSLRGDFPEAQLWSGNYENVMSGKTTVVLSEKGRGYLSEVYKKRWLRSWNLRPGSFMCTKSAFLECGGFPEHVVIGEDEMIADALVSRCQCAYDPQVVMSYLWDNRDLSMKTLHPSKHMEYSIDFEGMDGYRKLRMGEILGICFIRQFSLLNWNFVKDLAKKQRSQIPYSFYALFQRLIR